MILAPSPHIHFMHATNPHKGRTGLDRIVHAAGYSWQGLQSAYRNESAFRQETWLAIIMIPAAFFVGQTWLEVVLLISSVLLVMLVELLNSSIESVVDRISMDFHDLSKRAKDIGSAAVLIALIICGMLWGATIWAHWIKF